MAGEWFWNERLHRLGRFAGEHGFSILLLILVLGGLFVLLESLERSEKLAVELNIRSMQIGLKVAMAEAMMQGREAEWARWPGSNPVRWLGTPPEGYRGECARQEAEHLPGASWCFNREAGELVYRSRYGRHLRLADGGANEKLLRWRVACSANMTHTAACLGMKVQLMTPYVWFGD